MLLCSQKITYTCTNCLTVVQEWTPLHSAVSAGHTEIVQILISLKADVNAANSSGQTPLHYAVGLLLHQLLHQLLAAIFFWHSTSLTQHMSALVTVLSKSEIGCERR